MARLMLLIGLCSILSGCIYRHTVEPLTVDFVETPVSVREAAGNTKRVTYYIDVKWDKNGIGELARKHGFTEVYYADLETFAILGYWAQEWVHIYGK